LLREKIKRGSGLGPQALSQSAFNSLDFFCVVLEIGEQSGNPRAKFFDEITQRSRQEFEKRWNTANEPP